MQINATEIAGVTAFGMAAVTTGLAARRAAWARRTLSVVTLLYAAMATDVVIGLRHDLAAAVSRRMAGLGEYDQRRSLQFAAVLVVAVVVLTGGWWLVRRQDRRLRPSLAVVTLCLALFAVETVSLHQIDSILYHSVGAFMVIGLIWLALGLLAVETAERIRTAEPAASNDP